MIEREDLLATAPLLAAALWGGMYVVSKWGFAVIPPVTLSFLRVTLGAGTLLVLVRLTKPTRSFSWPEWRRFIGLGFWVTVTIVTQFVGTDLTSASQGSLLTVLTPVFTFGLGVVLLDESLTWQKLLGLALAVAGTLLVLAGRYDLGAVGDGNLIGVGLLLVASFGWAAFTVRGAPLVRRYSALETATYATVPAVPMIGLLVPLELTSLDGPFVGVVVTPLLVAAVVYLGVASTAVAWYCWYKGLEYTTAGTVAVFFFAQPVVGAILSALVLGESLGTGFLVGGLVMSAGVYLVMVGRTETHSTSESGRDTSRSVE